MRACIGVFSRRICFRGWPDGGGLFFAAPICGSALQARFYLMRALAPAGEILFFASPKKSIQRERRPGALHRSLHFQCVIGSPALLAKTGGHAQLAISLRSKAQTGRMLHPVFTAMLGCVYGRGEIYPPYSPAGVLIYPSRRTHRAPQSIPENSSALFELSSAARLRVVHGAGFARSAGNPNA